MLIHTPAPWKVTDETDAIWIGTDNPNENVICDIVGRAYDEETGDVIITGEDIANANLIAAAPELLTALENLMESYESRMGDWENADFNEVYRVARDVVAKAKGTKEHAND